MLIIINDNDQSIAENHGGLYSHLQQLRETNGESPNNIFKALGFSYRYVDDGNSLPTVIKALKECKAETTPIVLHIHTTKGYGYNKAITNPESFHNPSGFDIDTGETKKSAIPTATNLSLQNNSLMHWSKTKLHVSLQLLRLAVSV